MPHLVILYTGNLESQVPMDALCRDAADAMLAVHDEEDRQVFPTGGTRVLAYPAPHFAVADGSGDYGFMYLNLRMGKGRSAATQQRAGEAVLAAVRRHLDALMARQPIGVTLQVDEGHEVFDTKHSTLHPLFRKA